MSRPMTLSMCVEVSDWVQMSPADQVYANLCFLNTSRSNAECFRLNVFSTTVTAQHMSNTQYSLQVHKWIELKGTDTSNLIPLNNIGPVNSVQSYYWRYRPIYFSIFNKNCLFGIRSRYRHDLNFVFCGHDLIFVFTYK